jgi:hypothetical protein
MKGAGDAKGGTSWDQFRTQRKTVVLKGEDLPGLVNIQKAIEHGHL